MRDFPDPRDRRFLGANRERAEIKLSLETVTPILGGATTTRSVDTEDVIRAPSIRGQLRFWWRALYGHESVTSTQLSEREARIGAASRAQRAMRSSGPRWT